MKLSVVVPVFNEKETVETIIEAIKKSPVQNIEIVVVDDCSTDGTRDILKEKIEPVVDKVLYHEINILEKNQKQNQHQRNVLSFS